jgi:hypothetical protein
MESQSDLPTIGQIRRLGGWLCSDAEWRTDHVSYNGKKEPKTKMKEIESMQEYDDGESND